MVEVKLAAIKRKSDGIVFTGRNHSEIILTRPGGELKGSEQGFITNENIFVSRGEAGKIAFEAGQTPKHEDLLFSEDLTGDWPWSKEIIAELQAENKRLKEDYALLEELSPPDIPRKDFVETLYKCWEDQALKDSK